jgi:hypothetical protein
MSLLSRIQAAEAEGIVVGRRTLTGVEGIRERYKARLAEAAVKLARISRDEELSTLWGSALEQVARNERLENLGDYA